MSIFRGSDEITDLQVGGTPVQEVYRGSDLIWTRVAPVFWEQGYQVITSATPNNQQWERRLEGPVAGSLVDQGGNILRSTVRSTNGSPAAVDAVTYFGSLPAQNYFLTFPGADEVGTPPGGSSITLIVRGYQSGYLTGGSTNYYSFNGLNPANRNVIAVQAGFPFLHIVMQASTTSLSNAVYDWGSMILEDS